MKWAAENLFALGANFSHLARATTPGENVRSSHDATRRTPVLTRGLRGNRARRPRARHRDVDARGTSQAIESCKQQTPAAVSVPVSDQLQPPKRLRRADGGAAADAPTR
jgi:hypothetical protein